MEVDQWYIAPLSFIWPYKHKINCMCFSVQRFFIANKEKGDIAFFHFPYSKCMEVDQWYIARLSSFGLANIMVYVFSVQRRFISNKEIGNVSFFLIRNAWS